MRDKRSYDYLKRGKPASTTGGKLCARQQKRHGLRTYLSKMGWRGLRKYLRSNRKLSWRRAVAFLEGYKVFIKRDQAAAQ